MNHSQYRSNRMHEKKCFCICGDFMLTYHLECVILLFPTDFGEKSYWKKFLGLAGMVLN